MSAEMSKLRVVVVACEEFYYFTGWGSEDQVGETCTMGSNDRFGLGKELGLLSHAQSNQGNGLKAVLGQEFHEVCFIADAPSPGIVTAEIESPFWG